MLKQLWTTVACSVAVAAILVFGSVGQAKEPIRLLSHKSSCDVGCDSVGCCDAEPSCGCSNNCGAASELWNGYCDQGQCGCQGGGATDCGCQGGGATQCGCKQGCGRKGGGLLGHLKKSRCRHCGHHSFEGQDLWFACGCNGSYKFPVPPLRTYHWPGMFQHELMTDYHSPWRFPPLRPYRDEPDNPDDEVIGGLQPVSLQTPVETRSQNAKSSSFKPGRIKASDRMRALYR